MIQEDKAAAALDFGRKCSGRKFDLDRKSLSTRSTFKAAQQGMKDQQGWREVFDSNDSTWNAVCIEASEILRMDKRFFQTRHSARMSYDETAFTINKASELPKNFLPALQLHAEGHFADFQHLLRKAHFSGGYLKSFGASRLQRIMQAATTWTISGVTEPNDCNSPRDALSNDFSASSASCINLLILDIHYMYWPKHKLHTDLQHSFWGR